MSTLPFDREPLDDEEVETDMRLRDVDPEAEERDDDGLPTDTSDEDLHDDFAAMNRELLEGDSSD